MIQARRSLAEQPDIHARLMSQYVQVPEWWYLCIFLSMFVFGVIAIEIYPTQMPVWAFVLALAVAFVYTIPIGIIQAVTNQQIGLNVITELIVGYVLPGQPLAMMLFKTWGYIVSIVVCIIADGADEAAWQTMSQGMHVQILCWAEISTELIVCSVNIHFGYEAWALHENSVCSCSTCHMLNANHSLGHVQCSGAK